MAQINPAAYPTAYKISHVDADGTTPLDIEFSYDLATLVIEDNISMETYMDGSNSYGGFDATAHNYWVGGAVYGRAQGNPNDPANGGVSWSSHQVENPKQNLRWFLKITGGGGNSQGANPVRWTPQLDDDELTPTYNPGNEQAMTSVMTNKEVRLTEGGIYSNLYAMYPITKINLDKIQLYPAFTIIKYAFTYNDDDIITGISSTTTRYHWNDIKPEDNTAAGDNYNFDLWKYGFYDEMDTENPTHIKYRYVVDSCYVEQYYWSGKRSASGSAKLSTRIDNSAWDYSGDAVLPGNTGYNTKYGYLVPFSEGVFNVAGVSGVMMNPISGLIFGGTATSLNRAISFDTSKNNAMYYTNVNGQGTTMIASSTTAGTGFTLKNDENDMTASTVLISRPFGALFGSAISPDYDAPAHYETRDNGSIIHVAQTSGNRNVISLTNAPFPIEQLWQALASLGVYIVGTSSIPSGDFTLGQDFPSWLYHGEVLNDGTTTGVMIQGEDIEDLPTWDTIDYEPVIPTPTPPTPGDDSGGDDIRPSDWTNLRIGAANNFVTLYGMTSETVSDFGRKMWAQLADPEFWQMVGTAFTNDFSINPADMMRYFVSLRYFPFDVSDFAHTTSSGVYIGRAASPIAPSVGVAYPIRLSNSVVQVSGGSLTISRYYNDYRDYDPCTTVQVHVPFCGSVEIPASEVMGHTLDLTYKIDLQTGAMLAVLCVASNTYYVIATLAGTVGASIPITANNNIEFLQRIATIGGGLIGGGVSGALKGAMLGGEVGAVVGAVAGTVGGGVGALAGLPPVTVHKQGNASGFANLGGVPYAYATIQHSRFELPDNYGHTTGYACDFAATVGELSGYAVCDNVDTSGLSCNAYERDEIKRMLESGVYV